MAGTLTCPNCEAQANYSTRLPSQDHELAAFEMRGHAGKAQVFECQSCRRWFRWRKTLFGSQVGWLSAGQEDAMRAHRREVLRPEPFGGSPEQYEMAREVHREDRRVTALRDGRVECPECRRMMKSEHALRDHRAAKHDAVE